MIEKYNTTNAKSLESYLQYAPEYITKGEGVYVYDTYGNKFLDFGMTLGCISIGYCCKEIDDFVIKSIKNGVNFSRPSTLEKETAIHILNDFDSKDYIIRYSKSSSMLLNIIPRLCRHITNNSYIAYPVGTYLGNTDWYLSHCLNNSGILNEIKETTLVFKPGEIADIENLFSSYGDNLACIIMEPFRNEIFSDSYYLKLRRLCDKYKTILVFDETISGYRFGYPLAQNKINCKADITVIGKAISNGYSFSAAIIQENLMEIDSSKIYTFSTTHAGEITGLAATIATLEFYRKHNVFDNINKKGCFLLNGLKDIVRQQRLEKIIFIAGMPTYFRIEFNNLEFKNKFCHVFLKNNILCRGIISICYMHSYEHIEYFINVFKKFCLEINGEVL